jgi:formylmethanofuran dehydrogenase subunit E
MYKTHSFSTNNTVKPIELKCDLCNNVFNKNDEDFLGYEFWCSNCNHTTRYSYIYDQRMIYL